jgi:hypothetical protein
MKRVCGANSPADEGTLQLLKAALEDADIACMVRNESLSVANGDIPSGECVPELWILEDKDLTKAQGIVDEWKRSGGAPNAPWTCPNCKETSEGQFTSCWKCGTERE